MSATALETKAHELIGRLSPVKLAAVVQVMEAMIYDDEPVTEEDIRRWEEGNAWLAQGGKTIPMEEVLADFGLKMSDFPLSK